MSARTQAALKARVRRALKRCGMTLRIEPRARYHISGECSGCDFGYHTNLRKLARVLQVRA